MLLSPFLGDALDRIPPGLPHLLDLLHEHTSFALVHGERVSALVGALCRCLGENAAAAEAVALASLWHDVGKLMIDRAIISKPGGLTSQERLVIEQHSEGGWRILLAHGGPFAELAAEIARHHHENWDGNGYPDGLAGTAIPATARLVAPYDVFESVTSPDRTFYTGRRPMDTDEALALMTGPMACKFDPTILEAFCDTVRSAAAASTRS